MAERLNLPVAMATCFADFDEPNKEFTEFDVLNALQGACKQTGTLSEAEEGGRIAEIIGFTLTHGDSGPNPWSTYFIPMGSGTDGTGKPTYFPDIALCKKGTDAYWRERALAVKHPILRARYADLAWDLSPSLGVARRPVDMARLAVEAYLSSVPLRKDLSDKIDSASRALTLATTVRDVAGVSEAKKTLLELHSTSIAEKSSWWRVFKIFSSVKHAGVSNNEFEGMVTDLEGLLKEFSNAEDPKTFSPHAAKQVAGLLASHYEKQGKPEETRRVNIVVAGAFEHFGKLGDGMTGSYAYKEAEASYRKAGMAEKTRGARMALEAKIVEAKEEMRTVSTEMSVTSQQIKEFLEQILDGDAGQTLFNIAGQFLIRRVEQEKILIEAAEEAPLTASLPMQVLSENRVTAIVGSVHEDLHGRLIFQANQGLSFDVIWLREALQGAIDNHRLSAEDIATWTNRYGLYDDLTLIQEGLEAWFKQDHTKVMHVLVPQIEHGLRSIIAQLGRPTTRPHPRVNGASLALNMGEILNDEDVMKALGPDLVLHLLAVYADPRGRNLRNELAHGLIRRNAMNEFNSRILVHTLLMFGAWKEIAASSATSNT